LATTETDERAIAADATTDCGPPAGGFATLGMICVPGMFRFPAGGAA
jgi:hypothetical protein